MNKELEDKLDEIILYIKDTESYNNFLKAKEKLNQRDDLKIIIEKIKKLQQQMIKYPNKGKELEIELNDNLKILENDFDYVQYNNYLIEVNNLLNIFENKINKYFEDIFN